MNRDCILSRMGSRISVASACVFIACATATEPVGECVGGAMPAVAVGVQDSVSGAWIAAGAKLLLEDGEFRDSTEIPPERTDLNAVEIITFGSFDRAGTYRVSVRKAGYRVWVEPSVSVTSDECGVNTVRLTARLIAE